MGAERAENDAYWTPLACARACVGVLEQTVLDHKAVLEPAVGGGAWARALRTSGVQCDIHVIDIDPAAPGLTGPYHDYAHVADFMAEVFRGVDVILGNPPYSGDLLAWLDRSLQIAPVVGYLLRSTVLGSRERVAWWQQHPPAYVYTLVPRPKWEGPGARETTDTTDSVFVLWLRGHTDTRLRWLEWQ